MSNFQIPNNVKDDDWKAYILCQMKQPYFKKLVEKITESHKPFEGELEIFPPKDKIFAAFNECPLKDVKVVIVGQDPYHTRGCANGLCFAVNRGVKIPPSLRNIYKELEQDPNVEFTRPDHGDLTGWAKQGVLLLNTAMTVREGNAGSHSYFGWHEFTKNVLIHLSEKTDGVVFMLWGKHAQSRSKYIDASKHHVLSGVHPSPLSANRGWFGCRHFSKANEILKKQGKSEIDWNALE